MDEHVNHHAGHGPAAGAGQGHDHGHHHHGTQAALKDPVCGMAVTEASPHHLEHAGRPYWFCSARCKDKFAAEPQRYAVADTTPAAAPAAPAPAGTIYTCPMHPEIRQDRPGNCPKCGMALEPLLPDLDAEERNPELEDFTRRFWWTLPLTVVVTLLAMVGHCLGLFDMAAHSWIELALSAPVVLWAGWPFFVRWAQSLANHSPNMWTLIGTGVGAAFLYSVVATVAPQAFPASFVAMGRVAVYFEASAVIVSLTLLGQMLELRARRPRPPSSRCWAWLRRPRGAFPPTAARRTCHSRTCTWATCCACARARRCRWTAPSSKAPAPWTSPCSPASPCP